MKQAPTPNDDNEPAAENLNLELRTNAVVLHVAENFMEEKHALYILLSK